MTQLISLQLTRRTGEYLRGNDCAREAQTRARSAAWKELLPYALIEFLKQYVDGATLRCPTSICTAV